MGFRLKFSILGSRSLGVLGLAVEGLGLYPETPKPLN